MAEGKWMRVMCQGQMLNIRILPPKPKPKEETTDNKRAALKARPERLKGNKDTAKGKRANRKGDIPTGGFNTEVELIIDNSLLVDETSPIESPSMETQMLRETNKGSNADMEPNDRKTEDLVKGTVKRENAIKGRKR